MLTGDKFS